MLGGQERRPGLVLTDQQRGYAHISWLGAIGADLAEVEVDTADHEAFRLVKRALVEGICSQGPPVITSGPRNTTIAAGQPASLQVVASSSLPLRYQWFREDVRIETATSATLDLPVVSAADNEATFTVVVTNDRGSASASAVRSVVDSQPAAPSGQQISTGYTHSCAAVTRSLGVKCWGDNSNGQLGDGTQESRFTAVDVIGLHAGVLAVAAGGRYSCALTSNGAVKCWGSNFRGQLGDGTDAAQRLTPVDVVGLNSGVVAISAGQSHACALMQAGGLKCWGANGFGGPLGDGTTEDRRMPVDVVGLAHGVSAVSAGWHHTCAVMSSGGVKCWGENYLRQLGDGTTEVRRTPVDVIGLTSSIVSVAAGAPHTCAVTVNSTVMCWGSNANGYLGDGTAEFRTGPVDAENLTDAVAVSAGLGHACAVTSSGGVKCWGVGAYGELGGGAFENQRRMPDDVPNLRSGASAISAGGSRTCAAMADRAQCWGWNYLGALGDGTDESRAAPVDVLGL